MSKPHPLSRIIPSLPAAGTAAAPASEAVESFFPGITLPAEYHGYLLPETPGSKSEADSGPVSEDVASDAGFSRRRFLGTTGRGLTALLLAHQMGRQDARAAAVGSNAVFSYGVASGDPLPDRVILWTRVNPSPAAIPGSGLGGTVNVRWEVARDAAFTQRVAVGIVSTNAMRDHTIKVDAVNLTPNTSYYYRFFALNTYSPVGTTRTAPAAGSSVSSVRFALVSCSNYEAGFFSAYRHIAARNDLDFILHVGDYIYEYAAGVYGIGASIGRVHDPVTEIVTLGDYRRRYAQYRTDADLSALHQKYAWITTWDDHEVTNDCWNGGAENHQPATEGDFLMRRVAAYQCYMEWMPLRQPDRLGEPSRIYRHFTFGNLVSLSMLDLRQYRSQQPSSTLDLATAASPSRTMLGGQQAAWLEARLTASTERWHLLGNSVTVSPFVVKPKSQLPPQLHPLVDGFFGTNPTNDLPFPVPFNVDQWDGYTADRQRLINFFTAPGAGVNNVVFLTGDIHSSLAGELPLNPTTYTGAAGQSAAVEIVCPSVTSDNVNEIINQAPRNATSQGLEALFYVSNPHLKLVEFDSHGYTIVDVTPERVQADWYFITDRANVNSGVAYATSRASDYNTRQVRAAAGPVA